MKISEDPSFSAAKFGPEFKWGVASSAFQTEGAADQDGKGISIWDTFTSRKGSVVGGANAVVACEHYTRYIDDIKLAKDLGINSYRFSIAWTRIIPAGTGRISLQGIAYYNTIIDHCLELGIEPWVTLYHWDLPQKLEDHGGWTNREIITWFENYTQVCIHHFGDRVKYWMVANEPLAFTGAGYFLGVHAPGKRGLKNFLPALHHTVLAIAKSAKAIRESAHQLKVGTTFSCSLIEPASSGQRDIKAAQRIDALVNRLFIEPLTGSGYPREELRFLKKLDKHILPGDEELMHFDWDFIGIQNYTRELVRHSFFTPYLQAAIIPARKRKVHVTAMGWEVYPKALRKMIEKFQQYIPNGQLFITENGAAFLDQITDGEVNDQARKEYIEQSLKEVLGAKQDGLKIDGYFVWSLTDNFEWIEGYHPRFGLVHIDFETQVRTVKYSGNWYSAFLKG